MENTATPKRRRKKQVRFEPSGKAVVYCRVSTEDQADSGLGLAAQKAVCERFCRDEGVEIVAFYQDAGASGSLPVEERKGLMDAIATLGYGDVLVVAKLDRLARDMILSHMIERDLSERGCRLLSATHEANMDDTPSGRLMRGILGLLAEYERAQIAWRTAQALAQLKAAGCKTNQEVPYGKRVARRIEVQRRDGSTGFRDFLEDCPEELAVIDRMRSQRKLGMSYDQIADRLNEERVPTRHDGGKWYKANVRLILLREQARHPDQET